MGESGRKLLTDCEDRLAMVTFTFVLIGPVLAVDLSVAAQSHVHTLLAVALELLVGADGTVSLVTAVVTLSEAVAAPGLRDAVHLAGHTGELLRRTRGRLCDTFINGSIVDYY